MKNFDSNQEAKNAVQWVKNLYASEGYKTAKGAVLGISGGKDSGIVGKILVDALGQEKVYGVIIPNGDMKDISIAIDTCNLLGIKYEIVNIGDIHDKLISSITTGITQESLYNVAPRLRMTILYAIAQSKGYRVSGTGNASEAYVGYCTKWGDMAHDFNPIGNFTCSQVIAIGSTLGLPDWIINKVPDDGLCGKTDEERFGFSYEQIESRMKEPCDLDSIIMEKIDRMHNASRHKFKPIPKY